MPTYSDPRVESNAVKWYQAWVVGRVVLYHNGSQEVVGTVTQVSFADSQTHLTMTIDGVAWPTSAVRGVYA